VILFTKRLLAFTLILTGVFSLFNFFQTFYNQEPEHYRKQYNSIINFKSEYDGIILGTSHATHSIRPSILDQSGIRFYNYALNGSNPEYYYNWYNAFLHDKVKKPAYCLFAVDFFMFDKKWLWRRFEHDAEYFPNEMYIDALTEYDGLNKLDLIVNRYPFLKYRKQIMNSIKLEKGSKVFDVKSYDRGYVSYQNAFSSEEFKPLLKYEIATDQVSYFVSLLEKMQADKIKIVFVVTPELGIDTNVYNTMESLKIIDSIADKYDIPILNYNRKLRSGINTDTSQFSDWCHMNDEGSKGFSRKLASDLKGLGGN